MNSPTNKVEFFDKNSIYSNAAAKYGGVIYIENCNTLSLNGSNFQNNYAKSGGAILMTYHNLTVSRT